MIVGSPPINDPLTIQGRLNRVWAKWFSNLGRIKSAAAVSSVTTADATDLTTAIALANANKVAINNLLSSLRTAGLLDE
jgi:hypothetical protein